MAKSSIFKTFCEGLIQKHPKVFSIFLMLALIFLVIAGAFLVSDIMSHKSNAAQMGPLSSLYLKIPKESQATAKNWQEKGISLIDQMKSILGLKGPAKAADKDPAIRDKARALLAKNRLAKAKEARTRTENLSNRENTTGLSNSSPTLTKVQPLQATSSIMMGGTDSEGSSDSAIYSGEDSSSKDIENNHLSVAVTSDVSENQPQSNKSISSGSFWDESLFSWPVRNESAANRSALNESVSNDSVVSESVQNESVFDESVAGESLLNEEVMNESVSNKLAINESFSNESALDESLNSSGNTSRSLPAADYGSNSTRNSSYPLFPRNSKLSFEKLSSELPVLQQPQMNFAVMNSKQIHESLPQVGNGSSASVTLEANNIGNKTYNQSEDSNLKTNNDGTTERKAKNEPQGTMLDQRNNMTCGASASSLNVIPAYSVPDKTSNITSGQIITSLEKHTDSAPAGNTFLAHNSTSQLLESRQNQTYNLSESEPRLDGSSMSPPSLPTNKTEGLQNHVVKDENTEKKVSTSSGSAKPQESKKSLTNSANRFRTLKVPTPSWMTKAESKNKGTGT